MYQPKKENIPGHGWGYLRKCNLPLLTIFLMKGSKSPRLVPLDIVPRDPKPRHAPPKGPREFRERVKETVVDDLVEELGQDVGGQHETDPVHDEIDQGARRQRARGSQWMP